MAKKVNGVVHNMYNNATDSGGYAIPPLATNLALGQLVVNTSESDPCVLFKTSAGKIVKIVSEEVITKALTDILGNSAADLDTLRELIAQFEGSANDILPMLVALTDRVSAAESTLGTKANSSTVNAHIDNRENPHGVTKTQLGLGNLVNKEQLGKTETAADSVKLGGLDAGYYARQDKFSQVKDLNYLLGESNGFYTLDGNLSNTPITSQNMRVINIGVQTRATQMAFDCVSDRAFFRRKQDSHISNWNEFYHSGNSNKSDVDWTTKRLTTNGDITANGNIINNLNSYYIKTASSWASWGCGLYWQNASGTTLGSIQLGGGTGDTVGYMTFSVDDAERMRIKSNGYIGIGTASPFAKLDVRGSVFIKPDVVGNGEGIRLGRATNGWSNIFIGCADSASDAVDGQWELSNNTTQQANRPAHSLNLSSFTDSNSTVNQTWLRNGNVGIGGVLNPTEKLHVGGNGLFNGNVTAKGDVVAKSSGAVVFTANDQAVAGATRLNDLQDVKLPTNLAAKMILAYDPAQINSDGTTGGYTFVPAVGVGTGKVVADDVESLPDMNVNGGVYPYPSDRRLKENIIDLQNVDKVLLSLNPKSFTWNENGRKLGLKDVVTYGLIAQEVSEVLPHIVMPIKDGYIGVDYIKLIPYLLDGYKIHHNEIASMNSVLNSIKTRANKAYGLEDANAKKIAQLEAELTELKQLIGK